MSTDRLVASTWACRKEDLETALDMVCRAGYAAVEIWAEGAHLDPRVTPDVAAAHAWLADNPLTVRSVHLPFDGVLPDGRADERAQEWVRLCAQALDDAAALEARVAVLHPVLFADDGERRVTATDRFVATADRIAGDAAARGVRLAVENMHTLRGPTLRSVAELQAALARMVHPAGICLDIGHAVFNGFVDGHLVAEITSAAELLISSHVHDSDGIGRDPHLLPGDGVVDWSAVLATYREMSYAGAYVVEVAGGDDPVLALSRARERLVAMMAAAQERPDREPRWGSGHG